MDYINKNFRFTPILAGIPRTLRTGPTISARCANGRHPFILNGI